MAGVLGVPGAGGGDVSGADADLVAGVVEEDLCRLCNQDEEWHKQHRPRHPFRSQRIDVERASPLGSHPDFLPTPGTTAPRSKDVLRAMGADPVLRAALVAKGVLEEADLDQAEATFLQALEEGRNVRVTNQSMELGPRGRDAERG